MKQYKRLLSLLLTVALMLSCFAGLSLPAAAEETGDSGDTQQVESPYGLYVAGYAVTEENKDNVLGDAKISVRYDPGTNTLYLNKARITTTQAVSLYDSRFGATVERSCGIYYTYYSNTLTIELTGSSTVGAKDMDSGIWSTGLVVKGSGTLTAVGKRGIYATAFRQESGNVYATAYESNALYAYYYSDAIVANGGTLNAISMNTDTSEADGTALYAPDGKIHINNEAKVYATTSSQATNAKAIYAGSGIYKTDRHEVLSNRSNGVALRPYVPASDTITVSYTAFDENRTFAGTVYITPKTLYPITVKAEHGTIELHAYEGYRDERIRIRVWTPDEGYRLRAIHIKDIEAGNTTDIDLEITTYNPDLEPKPYYAFTMPDGPVEVIGDYVTERHTVHFDPGGGSGSMPDVQTATTDDDVNATITLPETCEFTPPAGDMTFLGWYVGETDELKHCGEEVTVSDDTTVYAIWQETHDGKTFQSWPRTNRMPDFEGSFFLVNDVELTESWERIGTASDLANVELCLNGKTLRQTAENACVIYAEYAILSIYDHEGDTGRITGGTDSGIVLGKSAIFYLYGGSISGNSSPNNGGGVCINNDGIGEGYGFSFIFFDGGRITENTAALNGGGIYVTGGNGFVATRIDTGTLVTGNSAGGHGGGVYLDSSKSQSESAAALAIGDAFIIGNTANGQRDNVYLPNGKYFTFGGTEQTEWSQDRTLVGVRTEQTPTADTPVAFGSALNGNNSLDPSPCFFSDDPAYAVRLNESTKKLELVPGYTVTFLPGAGSGEMEPVGAVPDSAYTLPENGFTAPDGEQFAGWQVGGETTLRQPGDSFTVTGQTTVTAHWTHTHDGHSFLPWLDGDTLPDATGDWYLMQDVTLTAQWTVSTGAITRLCLAGRTVTQSGLTGSGIHVPQNAVLELYDDAGAGKITGFSATENGGAIVNEGVLRLYGGSITANSTEGDGGAIYSTGDTAIYGGEITGNTARLSGGAISAHDGQLAILGGTLSGNSATGYHGGAIYLGGSATLDLRGGTITGNRAGNQGGGILANNTAERAFKLQGSAVVKDNEAASGNNIYLRPNNVLTVTDRLGENAELHVYTEAKPTPGSPVSITRSLSGKGDLSAFVSDETQYDLILTADGEAALAKLYVLQFAPGEGSGTMEPIRTADGSATLPESGFTAPDDRQFTAWQDEQGKQYQPNDSFSFTPGTESYTLTAIWETADHSITVEPSTGGSVSAPAYAKTGQSVTLTVSPDEGWTLDTLTVTYAGDQTVAVTENAFTMPAADVTVTATFRKLDYSVSMTHSGEGEVTASVSTAHVGDVVTLTVTPAERWVCKRVTVKDENGTEIAVENGSFTMPAANVNVVVEFERINFDVTVAESTNGTVTPDKETADVGETVTLTVTPDARYELKSLSVQDADGNELTVTDNTFTMPASNVTIQASFGRIYYSITTVTPHGSIEIADKAAEGETVAFTVTPDVGYELDGVTVTDEAGNPVEVTEDSFTMPGSSVTVTASYSPIDYTVTVQPSEHGIVQASPTTAHVGDPVALTITPEARYELKALSVQDAADNEILLQGDHSFIMPASNVTVEASFGRIYYAVNTSISNGSITCSADSAAEGDTVTFSVTPNEGYRLESITVTDADGEEVPVENNSFTMPGSSVTVTVQTSAIDYKITVQAAANGSITVTNLTTRETAQGGEEMIAHIGDSISLSYTANEGFAFASYDVRDADGSPVPTEYAQFNMPASNVTVGATFLGTVTTESTNSDAVYSFGVKADGNTVRSWEGVAAGAEVTVSAALRNGYDVSDFTVVTVGGSDPGTAIEFTTAAGENGGTTIATCSFTMPEGSGVKVTATIVAGTRTVYLPESTEGGSVCFYGEDVSVRSKTFSVGERVRLIVTTDEGYLLDSGDYTYNISNGYTTEQLQIASTGESYNYYFDMPYNDATVNVSFSKAYQISVTASGNGKVTCNYIDGTARDSTVTGSATANRWISISATPDQGSSPISYAVGSVSITCGGEAVTISSQSGNSYNFRMPAGDVEVHVSFVFVGRVYYSFNVEHGKLAVSPNNGWSIQAGQTVTVNATPDVGYRLSEVYYRTTELQGYSLVDNGDPVPITERDADGNPIFEMPSSLVRVYASFTPKDYSITVATGLSGGQLSASTPYADAGETVTLTAAPDTGYALEAFRVTDAEGSPVSVAADGSFTMPASNVTASADFVAVPYTVHIAEMDKGSVTPDPAQTHEGATVTLTVTPDEGYELDELTVTDENGETVALENNRFTMPGCDVTVHASFRPIDYTVSVAEATHGSVTADRETANIGQIVNLTVTPDEGYELDTVTVLYGENQSFTVSGTQFTMPAGNVTVSATFKAVDYSITVEEAANGTVTADKATAHVGDKITLTVTPAEGYELEKLTVTDGTGQTVEVASNRFTMPASDVTVTATFKIVDYSITVTETANGTVTADKATAHMGQTVTLTVTPAEGYELEKLSVTYGENKTATVENSKFTMPASNVTVTATFKAIDYTVTVTETTHGTATADKTTAHVGDEITLTVNPAEGYELDTLTATYGENETVTVADSKFTMPAADVTVTATFKAIDYTVTVAETANGTATADKTTAHVGDEITLTVNPAEGYELDTLTVTYGENKTTTVENSKFTMPASNVTVTATFKAIDYTVTVAETTHGTVTADKATAHVGDEITLTVTPDVGYELDTLTVTCGENETVAVANSKFTMPAASVTVTATFRAVDYPITVDVPAHVTVTVPETAHYQDVISLDVNTDPGFTLISVAVTDEAGADVPVADGSFTMPASGVTVTAQISAIDYSIAVLPAEHGSVSPSKSTANAGDEISFTVTPDEGYRLNSIRVFDFSYTAHPANANGFTMPAANVLVVATFAKAAYQITVEETEHGTISPSKLAADGGERITLTVTPDEGYELEFLRVTDSEGAEITVKNNQFIMPASDVTVTATFKATAPVSYTYFVGQSLTLNGDIGVNFYVKLNDVEPANAKVVFTWGNSNTLTVLPADLTADAYGRYKLTVRVAAAEMNDTITAKLYNGETEVSSKQYSVAQYARYILSASDETVLSLVGGNATKAENLRALCKAMLIYGAKSQLQFKYKVYALADQGLSYTLDPVGELGTTVFPEDFETATGLKYAGSSLVLESQTTYRLYFTVTDQTKLDALTVTLDGKALTYGTRGSCIYFDVANIAAAQVLKNFTLTFGDMKVTANAGEYMKKVFDGTDQTLQDNMAALYWYSMAAKTFFGVK